MEFAIFGDSYVSHLENYTCGYMDLPYECHFFHKPGMSTKRKFEDKFLELLDARPRYVFLILGGNDIVGGCNIGEILQALETVVERLEVNGVERVFVSSIVERGSFPKWTNMDKRTFNKIRRSINTHLSVRYRGNYVDMGKKLKFPRHYKSDLIHPGSKEGGLKVVKSTIHRCFMRTVGR